LVSPLAVNSLPLRLRTTGGPEGAGVPLIRPPPGAIAKTTGAAAGAPGAPAPRPPAPGPPARGTPPPRPPQAPHHATHPPPPRPPNPPTPTAPPPPPTFMRPISPLHTAAFQVGFTSQASSTSIPVMLTM